MPRSKGRTGRPFRRARQQVLDANPYCTLQYPGICTQIATTVDHIICVADLPPDSPLLNDPNNMRPACRPCNTSRGRNRRPKQALVTSRTW